MRRFLYGPDHDRSVANELFAHLALRAKSVIKLFCLAEAQWMTLLQMSRLTWLALGSSPLKPYALPPGIHQKLRVLQFSPSQTSTVPLDHECSSCPSRNLCRQTDEPTPLQAVIYILTIRCPPIMKSPLPHLLPSISPQMIQSRPREYGSLPSYSSQARF